MQPVGDPSDWTSPVFEPEIREGRIWARGSGDNKGQHFAPLHARVCSRSTSTVRRSPSP
ncbi:M20/M25/M40 family metallo-hydrolase [Pseudarthrobacter psychrotolerans]|uniref:M20/M25/M40 family metallo-hydrolase n=1 Tax=Pseudarthrobacter psychrotolerans TaxID=2697569 RepID=A0A6P1NGM6_9MICC|nr:M20/M25/M40 family metallo-hydrolase [Pseudarthrobacter psychrotolerans]